MVEKRASNRHEDEPKKKVKYTDACACGIRNCIKPGDGIISLPKALKPHIEQHIKKADVDVRCWQNPTATPEIVQALLDKRGGKGQKNHAPANAKHFKRSEITFKGDYKIFANPGAIPFKEFQWDKDYQLECVTKLTTITGGVIKCICTLGEDECGENIKFHSGHELPRNKKRANMFVRKVVLDAKLIKQYNKQINDATSGCNLFIHRRHFTSDHYADTGKSVILKSDAVPSFHVNLDVISQTRACPEEKKAIGSLVCVQYNIATSSGKSKMKNDIMTTSKASDILTPLLHEQRNRIRA
ncbi:hypothetical protein SARC_03362 [Sphaeroforma arctica JP610]|uniref:Uncharacterized protein n=1 Tax=Sphaeroforma arctica JP610 TaxID=667725 RepID=A0A0L0G5U7_9EUKA|nr:hypothetical protein SARC_03362 [Sphaeroforma arctica JP610]KNC84400.1 hypothetical protein SARC_03362 [Sphaeroforma arctica JP610]|eukprot:XP_014158302.1 hypothetical protein SARC_03362 [Sphaeroforma arctica JP610]